jgi:excinuclease ABC subunit C
MHNDFPKDPGVYLFKDESGKIIYVGKAKNLKNRVSSYFKNKNQSAKTTVLVSKIKSGDYIIVNNEVEALLLENKLIKEHSPKYNISLKDDKTYAYIKITDEKIPKLLSTRKVTKKGKYFGPYTDGNARNLIVKILNRHHKLCTNKCSLNKSCLNHHIGFCSGASIGLESKEDYAKRIDKVIKSLKGNIEDIKEDVIKQMHYYIEREEFEKAKIQKEIIESLNFLKQKQQVDDLKHINQDVIAIIKTNNYSYFSVLHIKKGTILKKENYKFENEELLFSKFLTNYYYGKEIPHEILVNEDFWETDKNKQIIENYLQSLAKRKVTLIKPIKGDKKSLVELAIKNLDNSNEAILKLLKEKLKLKNIPRIIECFDISNLKDKFIVAGMVRFKDLIEDKPNYRKFNIKTTTTQDDFKAMQEVIYRRYKRLLQEKKELPDLILIDGGLGQLNSAKKALEKLGLDIEVISIAKREEEIYLKNEELVLLDKQKEPLLTLRKIRDSVHNLAVNFNRSQRRKELKESFKQK